jgi:hypothetical protein|tara:strand:- start:239 stop:715 length:477 start_codon:yes stop_codon:yes gene_type:complete
MQDDNDNATTEPKKTTTSQEIELTDEQLMMASLGIDENQVVEETNTTKKDTNKPPNQENMRLIAKGSIKSINQEHGKLITFVTLVRDKYQLDSNGKPVIKNGKKIPRYKKSRFEGYYTIDKVSKFNEQLGKNIDLYKVSKMVQYVQEYEIANFTELGS